MYWNILKKDIKRKKAMNIILLLFAILAAMFVSSGLSNVITIANGTDYFLNKADIGDDIVITQNGDGGVEEILKKSDNVTKYKKEETVWLQKDEILVNGRKIVVKNSTGLLVPYSNDTIHYFHTNDEELTGVEKGEIYVTSGFLKNNEAQAGDTITIELQGVKKTYTIAGEVKDAVFGSSMMGNTRYLISDADYEEYRREEAIAPYCGCIFYVFSDNVKGVLGELTNAENILFNGERSLIKMCYVMEMIVAMLVLVLSIVLCIVSFVLLKFVITFTINEETREIGVMKAIGIKNFKIRSLYLTKYFAMAVLGGVLGFLAGIPFGSMLLQSVTSIMVLGQDMGLLLNALGAAFVILIMILFAYICTAKIKKFSPIDAIRDGQTGERYHKKSKLSLKKSRLKSALFLAVNDVASAPKRFLTILLSFFICSVFVFGVVLVVDTMKSDSLIGTFGKKSDVYIMKPDMISMNMMASGGETLLDETIQRIETDMSSLGYAGTCSIEVFYKYSVTYDGDTISCNFQQNKRAKASDYDYLEGTAPQNAGEIAITRQVSELLGAGIGDTVTIDFGSEKKECMVVALFQTMNQLGSVIRLHESAPTSTEYANSFMAYQVDFEDHPDSTELAKRIERIKKFYDAEEVFDAVGYCDDCMGVAATFQSVAMLLLVITCVVVILVTVLMERSFISDETSQIALLKAMGFSNHYILKWQIFRFMLVTIASEALAVVLTYPLTKLWCDPIWRMMGAVHVSYVFNPVTLVVIYPGIILLINFVAVYLTALYTNRITSNDVRNME